mgnify:CR=1 FL=1
MQLIPNITSCSWYSSILNRNCKKLLVCTTYIYAAGCTNGHYLRTSKLARRLEIMTGHSPFSSYSTNSPPDKSTPSNFVPSIYTKEKNKKTLNSWILKLRWQEITWDSFQTFFDNSINLGMQLLTLKKRTQIPKHQDFTAKYYFIMDTHPMS